MGLHTGLAVAFTAQKSAEFGHRPDCIAERQGVPGRILLGGGETLQDGDFGGRERHRRRLIRIDPHLVGHPQEPPGDNGIQRDRPFQPLTGFSWKVFDMTPSGFQREMQAFNPPAIAFFLFNRSLLAARALTLGFGIACPRDLGDQAQRHPVRRQSQGAVEQEPESSPVLVLK